MNREEAIKEIRHVFVKDFADEILKALGQDSSGDAIRRQAVLETLDDMDNVLDEDRTIENYKELLKECYEVLPPVNPQLCAVSREVFEQVVRERDIAIEQLNELGYEFGEKIEQEPKYCDRDICINNEYNGIGCDECEVTKSQEPETETGYWIDGWLNEYKSCPIVICSKCGREGVTAYKEFSYCPNCGAKMIEPQESEEV